MTHHKLLLVLHFRSLSLSLKDIAFRCTYVFHLRYIEAEEALLKAIERKTV